MNSFLAALRRSALPVCLLLTAGLAANSVVLTSRLREQERELARTTTRVRAAAATQDVIEVVSGIKRDLDELRGDGLTTPSVEELDDRLSALEGLLSPAEMRSIRSCLRELAANIDSEPSPYGGRRFYCVGI